MINTKERITKIALQLFLTKGYAVGINEIIEKSGTSKGAFYHHFASKGQLFIDTIETFFLSNLNEIDFIEDPNLSFRQKILKLVNNSYKPFQEIKELISEKNGLNYLSIIAEYPNHENLRNKNHLHFNQFMDAIGKIIHKAIEDGSIKRSVNINTLSYQIGMLIDGSIFDAIMMYNSVEKAEQACLLAVDQLVDILES